MSAVVELPRHRFRREQYDRMIDNGIFGPDDRLELLNGEIIGAMRRMPSPGDFRTNVHAGGRVYQHRVTPDEERICEAIGDRLRRDGLYFVGIDVIGNKLVEVNCVSPGGIPRINQLDGASLEVQVVDFIERQVAQMNSSAN